MMQAGFAEHTAILRIGTVRYVAPNGLEISLDIEAPSSVALNASHPRPFPRVNSYVLVATDGGYLVGQIEWIVIEDAPYPKRKGFSDFGVIDLPYPARKMRIAPLGILRQKQSDLEEDLRSKGEPEFEFKRGVNVFPSVGADVLLPTEGQLHAIVQTEDNRVKIGTCPLMDNADVYVDPDRLFGRHLAVLGNTGSGKSCSVAGLVRWSLLSAQKEIKASAPGSKKHFGPNARFIVLDPNGEYKSAFEKLEGVNVKIYSAIGGSGGTGSNKTKQLRIPMWFWNDEEWATIASAAPQTQRPVLVDSLKEKRGNGAIGFFRLQDIINKINEAPTSKIQAGNKSTLIMRIESVFSNLIMKPIINEGNSDNKYLARWLENYIGLGSDADNKEPSISIIDLSLVPSDIVPAVVAVVARMIFEALQRYRKEHRRSKNFPTVLVMEEAHNFIKQYATDAENTTIDALCCQAFEKIAREGRKFGLGMVVSSQRPSELSSTVLSQCNSFLIHRISNDRDQDTVSRLVPDNLRGLLRELPALPSQEAILLGWASELPLLVRMNDLKENERPASEDPPFWEVWTRKKGGERKSNWDNIAKKWQK